MNPRTILPACVLAFVAICLVPPVARADTCCANLPVTLEPSTADPGDTVAIGGLECRNPDNSGPVELRLGAFWLHPGDRAAEFDPDTVPGPGQPQDLPPVESWLPFDQVIERAGNIGDAVITVPDLPDGRYQLWWWCDGFGPGGGIHYSTGPRLTVGTVPDTATLGDAPVEPAGTTTIAWLPVALGGVTFGWMVLFGGSRRRSRRSP